MNGSCSVSISKHIVSRVKNGSSDSDLVAFPDIKVIESSLELAGCASIGDVDTFINDDLETAVDLISSQLNGTSLIFTNN